MILGQYKGTFIGDIELFRNLQINEPVRKAMNVSDKKYLQSINTIMKIILYLLLKWRQELHEVYNILLFQFDFVYPLHWHV